MTELSCWPLDNKQYTSVDLGAAYAARSRGLLTADSFSATTNGDNTLTLSKGVGCIHVSEFWAAFPYTKNDTIVQFEDSDGVYPRWDVIVLGYDKNGNLAGVYVRTGQAAQSPAMPELRRDNDFDEVFLYAVKRPVGATKIEPEQIVDLRLNQDYCGLMRDTIDTSVMQAAFEAFLDKIEQELNNLNAGTETMLKIIYDQDGVGKDIYKVIAANSPRYLATYTIDGWDNADENAKSKGYNFSQTVMLSALDAKAPAVTDASEFLPEIGTPKTGVAETDSILREALNIISGGVSTTGAGTVTTLVQEKPTTDLPVVWTLRTEV